MTDSDRLAPLVETLEQQGYSAEEIGKILVRVGDYEKRMQLDSLMDAIGSGQLDLEAVIKEALDKSSSG